MKSPFAPPTAALAVPLLAPLFLAGASCQASAAEGAGYTEIGDLVAHGEFTLAVQRAARLVGENPGDEQALEAHRRATAAYLMEQGRRMTFDDRDQEALEYFQQAHEADPEAEQPRAWLLKTGRKIGRRWYLRARDLHVEDQLEEAQDAYQTALNFDPELEVAREGLARLLVLMNYRAGLGEEYYIEGVRALHEYWLQVARSRFHYSTKYVGDSSRASRRVDEVNRMLSQQRMAVARTLEAEGLYHAARNEYHLAHLLDESNTEAVDGRDRMTIESDATRKADAAEMAILRGEHARARELIEEGLAITVEQKSVFEDKLQDIDDARAQEQYELALDLEHDFQYEAAIEAYERLLDEREWFEDARARLSTLEEYVVHAAELYERAAAAEDSDERVGYLQQIESFWPEYRDTHEQLEALGATAE